MTNPHEKAARARKVLRVVTYLMGSGIPTAQLALVVETMSDEMWAAAEHKNAADVTPCSALTRAAIVAELKRLSGEVRAA